MGIEWNGKQQHQGDTDEDTRSLPLVFHIGSPASARHKQSGKGGKNKAARIAECVAVSAEKEYDRNAHQHQYLLFETGQETPVTMLRCFEQVGTDNLAVNLDTANLILYGKANPVDALDVFGKYVRNLHAKDGFYPTTGHDLGCEVRIGDGKVDFRALFRKLKELGYDSYVTIEREISGEQQEEDIRYAKAYLENIVNEVYGG